VTCYTQPCKPCRVTCILQYLPQGDESSPRGRWDICAPALYEVLTEENGKMTESQFTIAVTFVTELISLGVLALVPYGVLINVCPLFLVSKPGQPDQWICITDMKKGHQNKSCAAYPVHMTCPEDILPQMYPGGFPSVIDASKFFHMFLTVDEERRFMGIIHPDTGDHYWYARLPMGSSNSVAVSGRFGAAFSALFFKKWKRCRERF
jgi:hypothetical protein